MPDDARMDLTGEVGSLFGDDLDDVLDALLTHVRSGRVLVVRNPDVRSL
jgi:hypothetical protein